MTSFPTRRRLLGQAVAAAGGVLLMGESGRAFATPQTAGQARSLPTIGQTINLSLNAFGATLFVNVPPPLPTLNFIGSMVVKTLVGGADFVRLQTLDFTIEAAHPMFGKVTLRLPDIDVSPASVIKIGPSGLVMTLLQSFDATFERSAALDVPLPDARQRSKDAEGPVTYTTLSPAKWVANLQQFPPPAQGTNPDGSPTGGALYQLQAPIQLGTIDGSGNKTQYAQLQGMNINVGQLL